MDPMHDTDTVVVPTAAAKRRGALLAGAFVLAALALYAYAGYGFLIGAVNVTPHVLAIFAGFGCLFVGAVVYNLTVYGEQKGSFVVYPPATGAARYDGGSAYAWGVRSGIGPYGFLGRHHRHRR